MSESVDNCIKELQRGQHRDDAVGDASLFRLAIPSLELDSKDKGVVQATAPKLTQRKRSSDRGLIMASYNSAFLEDLFEDVAATLGEEPTQEGEQSSVEASMLSLAVPSDHNLSKRRRVSTNKSLGRSEKSFGNLASFADRRSSVRKESSVLLASVGTTTKLKKDLPATISASYSFTLDSITQEHPPKSQDKGVKNQSEDFGWFVDTDVQQDVCTRIDTPCGIYSKTDVPLAFSAATAVGADTEGVQAEVEWAQAADMVDEVLGDFF